MPIDNMKIDSDKAIDRLYDQEKLLDILIEFEAVLDSLDLYAFENWFNGEVVSGPHLERYWINVVLKYPYKEMPNPEGGNRLLKHGAKVGYELTTQEVPEDITKVPPESRASHYENGKRKMKEEKVWLIHIKMPRRFIEDMETGVLDIDDEEEESVDLSAAQTAEEEGLTDETALENEPTQAGAVSNEEEFNQ